MNTFFDCIFPCIVVLCMTTRRKTQQRLLAQLPVSDIVQLLGVDKLQDILKYMCQTDQALVLAAFPKPTEMLWIKDISEWFYVDYETSPIRLQWQWWSRNPRYLKIYDNKMKTTTAIAITAHEVHSVIIPKIRQYNIKDDAVGDIITAAADYFTRKADPSDTHWMSHSNMLGRR